jgi:eukaryotic-like serine/threonine-protein kinase
VGAGGTNLVDGTLIQEDEAARIAAVKHYEILDRPADGAFDRITALAARHFDAPIAIVSVLILTGLRAELA